MASPADFAAQAGYKARYAGLEAGKIGFITGGGGTGHAARPAALPQKARRRPAKTTCRAKRHTAGAAKARYEASVADRRQAQALPAVAAARRHVAGYAKEGRTASSADGPARRPARASGGIATHTTTACPTLCPPPATTGHTAFQPKTGSAAETSPPTCPT